MWINCDFGFNCNTQLRYYIDSDSFYVNSVSAYSKIGQNTKLYVHFFANSSFIDFEIGSFVKNNDVYKIDKKYTLSYLLSNNININSLSHFSYVTDGKEVLRAYPQDNYNNEYEDKSITRAKQTLESLKELNKASVDVKKIIDIIKTNFKKYNSCSLPILTDFKWCIVDDNTEFFSLSSVRHLISSDGFTNTSWYFGKGNDDRLYAVASRCNENNLNPFTNANDCAIKYVDYKSNEIYYAVGILLLDDGQYFCRLN